MKLKEDYKRHNLILNLDLKVLSWNVAGREEGSTDLVLLQIPMRTPWDILLLME